MWDLIVSVPDHCLSFYFSKYRGTKTDELISAWRLSLSEC